jgi:spectrin alpha
MMSNVVMTIQSISERRKTVLGNWDQFKQSAKDRRTVLENAQVLQKYLRSADELEEWILEKIEIANDESWRNDVSTTFQSKLKFHKDFEDDIEAQVSTVEKVGNDADVLLDLKQYTVDQDGIIEAKKKGILATWDLLKERAAVKKQKLVEGSTLSEFQRDAEEVLSWISKQAELASAADVGLDFEAVEMLEKRFAEFRVSLRAAEAKMITEFTDKAIKLISDAHPSRDQIKELKLKIGDAWAHLQQSAITREKLLNEAREVHLFNRNVEETVFRIKEKDTILSSDVEFRDLAHAEQLLRKHERLDRDLKALEDRVNEIKRTELAKQQVVAGVPVALGELDAAWQLVQTKATGRKTTLDVGHEKQKFLSEWNTYSRWIGDTVVEIDTGVDAPLGEDGTDILLQHATASQQQHAELNNEIEARTKKLLELKEAGQALVAKGEKGMQENILKLDTAHDNMKASWARQEIALGENVNLCTFMRNAQRVETWVLDRKSALDAAVAEGDHIESVDGDLKKHEHFQKSLQAQLAKMDDLQGDHKALIDSGHPAGGEIMARLQAVDVARTELATFAATRHARLLETLSLQTFLRDVNERQNWITEKLPTTKLPEGDVDETSNLRAKLQRHHNFQAELDSNQTRIDETQQQGEALVKGGHYAAAQIQDVQGELLGAWTELCHASQLKAARLTELNKQQQLNFVIDDLEKWCAEVAALLASQEFGTSVPTVSKLVKKHQLVLADIKSHKAMVVAATKQGQELIDANHFRSDQIQTRITELGQKYADLTVPAGDRGENLEGSRVLEELLRDVKGETIWVEERIAASFWTNFGTTVDDVQSLQKKHVVLQHEMDNRYNTAAAVIERATALSGNSNVARVELVKAAADDLNGHWQILRQKADERSSALEQSFEVQQYFADVTEIETVLSEKTPLVQSTDYGANEDITKDMQKKHEAVLADLDFQKATITEKHLPENTVKLKYEYKSRTEKEIGGKKDELFKLFKKKDQWWHVVRTDGSDEKGYIPASYLDEVSGLGVVERYHAISAQCDDLLRDAAEREKRLTETLHLFALRRTGAEVKLMIDENQKIAQQQELGSDLEHNELITNKFEEFARDLQLKESQVTAMNQSATVLIDMGHTDSPAIQAELAQVTDNWAALTALAQARKVQLSAAQEVHRYNRDADEATVALADKAAVVASDDFGKDLDTVIALQTEHANTLRVLAATLAVKVDALSTECARLCGSQPPVADELQARQNTINDSWKELQANAERRKEKLNESKNYQSFLKDYHDLASWISGADKQASSDELAADVGGAEELLKRHQELQSEIEARASDVDALRTFGGEIVKSSRHGFAPEVEENLRQVELLLGDLSTAMAGRHARLQQCLELQLFNRSADEADAWIGMREAALAGDDVGTTLDSVEASIERHTDMEKSIASKAETITQIGVEAGRLVSAAHYDRDAIHARNEEVVGRWAALLATAEARKAAIDKAHKVQQFLRDSYEKEEWVTEKLQVAKDPSYKDPSNLHTKVEKHKEFEVNVTAYQPLLASVLDYGREILAENAAAGPTVQPRVDRLEELWGELSAQSADKSQKLKEARDQQQFNHGLDDLEFWLQETERVLQNTDLGKDLSSAKSLSEKHTILVADIAQHEAKVAEVDAQATKFCAEGHFAADLIQARQRDINTRYSRAQGVSVERTQLLRDSLRKQEILRLIDEELSWIREKKLIAASQDFGRDLTGVQNLMKKHEAFTTMLSEHKNVDALVTDASVLLAERHYAAAEVTERATDLKKQWVALQATANDRRKYLAEALDSQQLQSNIDEEESWIQEKLVMVQQEVVAETLSSADALIRKHVAFEDQCDVHRGLVQKLVASGRELIRNQNQNSSDIETSVTRLEQSLADLTAKGDQRKARLADTKAMLEYNRKADGYDAWISDKKSQATSQEVGKDLTTVGTLLTKHGALETSLKAKQKSIDEFRLECSKLAATNSHSAAISAKGASIMDSWEFLIGSSQDRRAALLLSQDKYKELEDLHLEFAKKASGFNSWFENAEEDLTDPVRVNSLEDIEQLKAAHRGFEQEERAQKGHFEEIVALDSRIKRVTTVKNPYTWFSLQHLENSWATLREVVIDRKKDIEEEEHRQRENEDDRKVFAKYANEFYAWLQTTRASLVEGSGTLETQLENTKGIYAKIGDKRKGLSTIEDLSARMEEKMILDNRHTEHSIVGLAQQWDQLEQLGVRMQHNLEQQIQAKNASGVSDEKMAEFRDTFEHFDHDKSGFLDAGEIKACLRSLGMVFATIEEGEVDPEWEAVIRQMDPNGDGVVSLDEFRKFMINRESDKAESSADVLGAFAAASGDKPYMTRQDLEKAMGPEQADYCMRHMKQFVDGAKVEVGGGFDYSAFIQGVFQGRT